MINRHNPYIIKYASTTVAINYEAIHESPPHFHCFVWDLILRLNENNIEKEVRGTHMSHIIIDKVVFLTY